MSEIKDYTKKPVTIQAMIFEQTHEGVSAAIQWMLDESEVSITEFVCSKVDFNGACASDEAGDHTLFINTLEGQMVVSPGDYIIRGVQGEFYPCKPDIFKATYYTEEDLGNEAL